VNKKDGSSTDDWNDDDCDHVSINGGVEPKRCDRDIDDEDVSASLADVGQRPTKSCRFDADAPTSSMWVRPVAAASDTAEKDGGDAMADDHFHGVSAVTQIRFRHDTLRRRDDTLRRHVATPLRRLATDNDDSATGSEDEAQGSQTEEARATGD